MMVKIFLSDKLYKYKNWIYSELENSEYGLQYNFEFERCDSTCIKCKMDELEGFSLFILVTSIIENIIQEPEIYAPLSLDKKYENPATGSIATGREWFQDFLDSEELMTWQEWGGDSLEECDE